MFNREVLIALFLSGIDINQVCIVLDGVSGHLSEATEVVAKTDLRRN